MIPLLGLCDTVSVTRRVETSSYGSISVSESTLVSSWKCRKTEPVPRTINELVYNPDGEYRDNSVYFTGEYNSLIADGDIIIDASSNKFEIIKLDVKRDMFGNNHHLYLTTRKRG